MELWTPMDTCDLNDYSIIVAEQSTSRSSTALRVRSIIELTSLKLTGGKHLGLIVQKPMSNGVTGIVPNTVKHFKILGSSVFSGEKLFQLKKEDSFLVLILLHSKTQKVTDVIKKKPRRQYVSIELEEKLFIHATQVDYLVVTGPQGPQSCKVVNEVFGSERPKLAPFDKFLIEHQADRNFPTDLSVNRCGSVKPFDLRSFRHCKPSPGSENNCQQSSEKFVKDDHIHDSNIIDQMEIEVPAIDEAEGASVSTALEGACEDPVAEATNVGSQNAKIQQSHDAPSPCHSEDLATQRFGPTRVALNLKANQRKKLTANPNFVEKFRDKQRYQPLWSQQMKRYQSNIIDVDVAEQFKEWFNYFFNPAHPEKSTFGCWLCYFYRHLTQFRENYYSKMATEKGILHPTKQMNNKALREHATSVTHLRTYEEAAKYELYTMDDDTIMNMKPIDNPMIVPTNNVVDMIYQESKMNIPGNKHPMMFDYIKR